MKPHIAVCLPRRMQLDVRHLDCLDRFRDACRPEGPGRFGSLAIHTLAGADVVRARTVLTQIALAANPKPTHLLWIDDDMTFGPDFGRRLFEHDREIVGGLCHNRRAPYNPILGRHPHPVFDLGPTCYQWLYDYPDDRLVEVDCTGGAFLLVKREVFDRIEGCFGPESWWKPIEECSEDISFCWRANETGSRIFVDTGLDVGHLASVVVDKRFYRANSRRQWGRWNPHLLPASGKPRVSVVIPTFNQRREYLLAAVQSARGQNIATEVIVVDDGSRVPVADLPEGVKLIRFDKNRGIAAALNAGIEAASTDWIAWLSSDDLFDAIKLDKQLYATLDAGAKASFHGYNVFAEGNIAPILPLPTWRTLQEQMAVLRQYCAINGSTTLIHRSVFDEVGLFDESLRYGQDWEMWLRIGERHLWLLIDEVLGTRREGENLTAKLDRKELGDETARRDAEDALIREKYRV